MKRTSSAFMGILVLVIAVVIVGAVVYLDGGTYVPLGEAAKIYPVTQNICEKQYVCKNDNERCYQNERCNLSDCEICQYGCKNGMCN